MKKFSRYLNRLLYTAVIPASMLTALTAEATYQYGDFYYENVHAMTYDLEMVNPKGILYSGHIKIPSTANGHKVTSIGDNMFKGCEDLTEITLTSPTFIKNIGKDAFDGCSALTTVNIPNLDDWYKIYISPSTDASSPLFWAKLPSVDGVKIDSDITIKNSVEEISAGNFMASGVTSLTVKEFKSGNISYSIHLGTGAFKNAKDLKTVNIERSSSRIDEEAFYGCSSLENVSITYLEDYFINSPDPCLRTARHLNPYPIKA